ncbi:MAG: hypothetical protein ACTHW2_01910 [Tissierella sp.]
MLLQAQSENKDTSIIIGDDYEEFCQSIIKEYETNKNTIYKIYLRNKEYEWLFLKNIKNKLNKL